MLNQTVLVGRLTKKPTLKGEYAILTLAVNRTFKNEEGIYETDFIPVETFGAVATNTYEYCTKGDIIGVKGRLQNTNNKIIVIAEKVTFLASKKSEE